MEEVDICESPEPQLLGGKGEPVRWGGGADLLPHLKYMFRAECCIDSLVQTIAENNKAKTKDSQHLQFTKITIFGGVKVQKTATRPGKMAIVYQECYPSEHN